MGIRVPPDSTGQTVETNSPDGTTQRQVVTLGDKTATTTATVGANGLEVKVTNVASVRPSDGTNAITQTFDLDSGAGTDWQLGVNLRKIASGGSVEAGTSTNPLRTDPTGTTIQPVSGTVAFSNSTIAVTNTGTFATQAALSAGTNIIGKVGIDQTTPGTTNAVAATNLPTTVDTNSGVKSASTLRVVLATDQPQLTNKLLVTPDSVALPANQSVNVSQINAVTPLMGNGVTGTGSQRVTIASDNTPFSVNISDPDTTATGNITTQNLVPAGTATANSAVLSGTIQGETTLGVQVTGTYTGALSLQGTIDNSTWVTIGGAVFINVNTGAQTATIASGTAGIFQADCAGFQQVRVTGLAAMTGTAVVTMRLSTGAGLVALDAAIPTGANVIGALTANQSVNVGQINAVTPLMGNGVTGTGSQRVTIASDNTAFSVNAVQSGTWTVQPGNTANTTAWLVSPTPATSGGCSKFHLVSAATTNLTNVKASAGQLYGWRAFNTNASTRYIKLHNTAGTPTAGSGVVETIAVPGGGGSNGLFDIGVAFATGIGISMVTGIADADTTAVGASDLVVDLYYK